MASKYGDNPKCSMIRSANTLGLLVATNMRRPDDLRPESGGYAGIQFVLVDTGFCKAFSIEQQRVLRFLSAAQQLLEASEERGANAPDEIVRRRHGSAEFSERMLDGPSYPKLGIRQGPIEIKANHVHGIITASIIARVMSAVFAISRRVRSTSDSEKVAAAQRT